MADLPITKLTSLQIDSPINPVTKVATGTTQGQGSLILGSMTTVQSEALINNPAYPSADDTANKVVDGTLIFNTDNGGAVQVSINGNFVSAGGGGNVSYVASEGVAVVKGNIVIFNDDTGQVITGSGVPVVKAKELRLGANPLRADVPLWQIGNLAALQFGDSTSTGDTGVVLIDSSTAVTFQENQGNACTIISSGLPEGSSSPSATLEVNTNEGAFLPSRLNNAQMNALTVPVAGMIIYNTDAKQMMMYSGTSWSAVGGGGITGPASTTAGNIVVWGDNKGKTVEDTNIEVIDDIILGISTINLDNSENRSLNFNTSGLYPDGRVVIGGTGGFGSIIIQSQMNQQFLSGSSKIIFPSCSGTGGTTTFSPSYTTTGNVDFILPASQGSDGQILQRTAGNSTSWVNKNTITTQPNSGITLDTDAGTNVTTVGLSFANIDSTAQGDVLSINNVVHVNSFTQDSAANNYSFLSQDSSGTNNENTILSYSIKVDQGIIASQFNALSSKNVKSIITSKTDEIMEEVYELFQKINLVKYNYKDQKKYGKGIHYGVIAEEIQRDFPHLVQDVQSETPNIMRKGKVEYINSRAIRIHFEEEKYWDLQVEKDKKVVLFSDKNVCLVNLTIESINGTNELILSSLTDLPKDLRQVFVYGTEENCPSVAKERLFEMSMCVTQSLMNKISDLTARVNKLEQN